MKVYIDGRRADTDERTEVSITLSVASQSSLETSRTGYSKTILLPMTSNNAALLGMPEDVNAVARFNDGWHTARIEKDGCAVLEGMPRLIESVCGEEGYYRLIIVGAGCEWVRRAAETPLRDLGVEFAETYSGANIERSWTWDKPVRFLPVHRTGLEPLNPTASITPPQRALTADDYHPFLHLATILRRTFAEAGYRLESPFMDKSFFRSIYISGNYVSKDSADIRRRIDFMAGRTTSATSTANNYGIIYASPHRSANTFGNLVDTTDPVKSTNGVRAEGVFSNGNYFRMAAGGHFEFRPPFPVTVAFECNFVYTTDYSLDNATGRLRGFDTISLGPDSVYEFKLKTPFDDFKHGVLLPFSVYRVVIPGHTSGNVYQLEYREVTNPSADLENLRPGDYTVNQMSGHTGGVFAFETGDYPFTHLRLRVRKPGESIYKDVEEGFEWGVYDAAMTSNGTMDVEVTLRTKTYNITPSNPKTFHDIYIGGAISGQRATLRPGTTLRPVFSSGAVEGETLDFGSVAAHDNVSCLDVVKACKQMFNLYFITDRAAGTVYVYPRKDFYSPQSLIDLTGRIDSSRPITVSEPAGNASQLMTFCYAQGDGAVGEYNRANDCDLGVWSASIDSSLATEGEKRYANPLFAPSVNSTGAYSRARDASLLRVGGARDGDGMNFPMKVVSYMGMHSLPGGQTWGWPNVSAPSNYPLLAFHSPGHGISLAFEDHGQLQGLNQYWESSVEFLKRGRRLTLWVDLQPPDIEPLIHPDYLGNGFRALFRLSIGGESILCRLEEVVDYNPGSPQSTKCVFIKEN